ncbi:MAG: hypothetical protein AAF829_07725 [Pseudomonadota bacterium]
MALFVSSGMHFGGFLGGGGLALVAAGCAFLQANQASVIWPMPLATMAEIEREIDKMEPAVAGDSVEPSKEVVVQAPDALPQEPERITPASGPPTLAPPPSIAPARQVSPPPATAKTDGPFQPATFIVKFKENDAIDDIIANWRRDREAAEATFSSWAAGDPIFSAMVVVGCSYSGELILEASVPAAPSAARARVTALVNEIRAHSAVAYADPDFTAQPGNTEN